MGFLETKYRHMTNFELTVTLDNGENDDDDGLNDVETVNGDELDESVRVVRNGGGGGGGPRGNREDGAGADRVSMQIIEKLVGKSNEALGKILEDNKSSLREIVEAVMDHGKKRGGKQEEGKAVLTDKEVRVKDDNNTTIDAFARNLLCKNPNSADPSSWWSAEFENVSKPVLGESLCLGHLGPGTVNPDVILKMHDRCKVVTVKELLTSNSGYGGTLEQNISAKKKSGGGTSSWEFAETKSLKNAVKLEEVVEAGLNYQEIVFMVRNWDWTGVAVMRVAHACRYFKVRRITIKQLISS